MDVRQLAALVAVAETGSVTRAAEVLRLVQPAVSRQIKLLEDELGAPLFERTRHGMALTDDGRILLEHARRALSELERARAEIRPASGELRGLVTLGLSPSIAEPIGERWWPGSRRSTRPCSCACRSGTRGISPTGWTPLTSTWP